MQKNPETVRVRSTAAVHITRVSFTVFAAIAVGLVGTGGTYAFLNASAMSSSAATITAGTASLQVAAAPAALSNLYPGQVLRSSFTVTNSGDVPLALSVTSLTGTNATNQLLAGVAPGDCSNSPASGVSTGAIGSTVAAGITVPLCLVVSMPVGATLAAAGQSAPLAISILGTQQ